MERSGIQLLWEPQGILRRVTVLAIIEFPVIHPRAVSHAVAPRLDTPGEDDRYVTCFRACRNPCQLTAMRPVISP